MTFVQNYSKNVTEGNVFANPIAVQVLGKIINILMIFFS